MYKYIHVKNKNVLCVNEFIYRSTNRSNTNFTNGKYC